MNRPRQALGAGEAEPVELGQRLIFRVVGALLMIGALMRLLGAILLPFIAGT